jgi:hypothetical protein
LLILPQQADAIAKHSHELSALQQTAQLFLILSQDFLKAIRKRTDFMKSATILWVGRARKNKHPGESRTRGQIRGFRIRWLVVGCP